MITATPHETLGEILGSEANCAGLKREVFKGLLEIRDENAVKICEGCVGRQSTGDCPEGLVLPVELTKVAEEPKED